MKILYARYSRERHPHFQMKTVIYEENGLKKVMKQAINQSGSGHIQKILKNYEVLKNQYKADVLLDPIYTGDALIFEYLDHFSLEQLVLEAAINKNKDKFLYFFELYKQFINEVALDNYSEFSNTTDFVSFFKKHYPLEGLRTFSTPNIDLNFDNIFMLPRNNFKVLDCEWVLSFPVPVEFVVFRAINTFYYAHYSTLINFVEINELFELFGISLERVDYYVDMSVCFAEFVGTNQAITRENVYLKEATPFQFKEPEVLSAQLFYSISEQEKFTEINSIKMKIDANTKNLNYQTDISVKYFRFDPADKKCIILLKNITVYDDNANSIIVNEISSNAIFTINSNYFFATDDPQICFSLESDIVVSKVEINLEYIHFIDKEFFLEMGQSYEMVSENNRVLTSILDQRDRDYRLEIEEKERLLQDSYDEKENLNNTIEKLDFKLKKVENQLKETDIQLKETDLRLNETDHKLKVQSIINDNLLYEKSQFISENERLLNDLKISEQFINKVKSSIWWKIKNKTKSVVSKIIGKLKGIYK